MNLRKVGLMSLLALAAVALAAPSMASANWLNDHDPIHSNQLIDFHGEAGFGSEASGTTCTVEGTIKATSSTGSNPTTGHLIDFTIGDHADCTSTGLFAGCEIASHPIVTNSANGQAISTNNPLPVHIAANDDLILTNLTIDTLYTHPVVGACRVEVAPGVFFPITGNQLHLPEVAIFDLDDADTTTVDALGAETIGTGSQVTLFKTTTEQAENKPFAAAATAVNTAATELELTEPNTWGWNG